MQATQAETLEQFLEREEQKGLLRFSTAGSVDDGKSTLIGRLLYDSKGVYEDQLASVQKASATRNAGPIDFSLLTDGLKAEREQGITIDVAYRYFATPKRKFIIADTPGHEQYTRNMCTGASTAHVAIVLVDSRKGLLPQSRRHAYIASLLGIPHVIVAINKMDLVDFSSDVYQQIEQDFLDFAKPLGIPHVYFVPISALDGDNVVRTSPRTPWYTGPSLLTLLEEVPLPAIDTDQPFRMAVQLVLRPHLDWRGYAGQIGQGSLRPGSEVLVLPSGRRSRVTSISTYDGLLDSAFAPQSVAITLQDEIDISRGDMLVSPDKPPLVATRLQARVVWMHETPSQTGKPYLLKHTSQQVTAAITEVRHRIDVLTLAQHQTTRLELNEIGSLLIETQKPLYCDPYRDSRNTGNFILIDPMTNATIAAGMVESVVATESYQPVTASERMHRNGHGPLIVALPGRTSLARMLERRLFNGGALAAVMDEVTAAMQPVLRAVGLLVIVPAEQAPPIADVTYRDLPGDDHSAVQVVLDRLETDGFFLQEHAGEGEGI